ncbi:hypothetical protein LVY75_05220 (plasmid) [Sinorhizobium sp. B11]
MREADGTTEVSDAKEPMADSEANDPAVAVFLRGRGGRKAQRTEQDYSLGDGVIERRKDETP